jgi:hypothetical protein
VSAAGAASATGAANAAGSASAEGPASAAIAADAAGPATSTTAIEQLAPPRHRVRWQSWLLGAAILVALVVVATRGSSPVRPPGGSPAGAAAPGEPSVRGDPDRDDGDDRADRDDRDEAGGPREIRVAPPAGMDGKQTRDWDRMVDALRHGHYDDARHKLREFEDRYGQTDETRALAPQLDQLGPDAPRGPAGPPGHGRGKKHRE